ncbi:MAG: hypothetical protein LW884_00300 [Bacteroidetes bacterium]|jgi:hypothetical protein|nr:hypothetical protein [Bacteroidota bacterium]
MVVRFLLGCIALGAIGCTRTQTEADKPPYKQGAGLHDSIPNQSPETHPGSDKQATVPDNPLLDSIRKDLFERIRQNYGQPAYTYTSPHAHLQWGDLLGTGVPYLLSLTLENPADRYAGYYTLNVYQKLPQETRLVFSREHIPYGLAVPMGPDQFVRIQDFTFDDKKDIWLYAYTAGGTNQYGHLLLYKPKDGSLGWVANSTLHPNLYVATGKVHSKTLLSSDGLKFRQTDFIWSGADTLLPTHSYLIDYGRDSMAIEYHYMGGKITKADTLNLRYPYVQRRLPRPSGR